MTQIILSRSHKEFGRLLHCVLQNSGKVQGLFGPGTNHNLLLHHLPWAAGRDHVPVLFEGISWLWFWRLLHLLGHSSADHYHGYTGNCSTHQVTFLNFSLLKPICSWNKVARSGIEEQIWANGVNKEIYLALGVQDDGVPGLDSSFPVVWQSYFSLSSLKLGVSDLMLTLSIACLTGSAQVLTAYSTKLWMIYTCLLYTSDAADE